MSDNSEKVRQRAEAGFKKAQKAEEGAKARLEYEAAGQTAREKTSRLKSLRLAKEAAEKKTGVVPKKEVSEIA